MGSILYFLKVMEKINLINGKIILDLWYKNFFLFDFDIVFKYRDELEGVIKRFLNMIKELRYWFIKKY